MAFGDQVDLTYSVEDAKGKTGSFIMHFPDNTDIPGLIGDGVFAQTTAQLIDPLIDGVIKDAGAVIGVDISGLGLKTSAISGSDVEEGALFTFRSTEGAPTKFRLPTFDETYGLETGQAVDTSAPDVDSFIQRIINGDTQGATTVRFADSRGNNVDNLVSAKDSFRRRKRK